jgi:hypothetical protein
MNKNEFQVAERKWVCLYLTNVMTDESTFIFIFCFNGKILCIFPAERNKKSWKTSFSLKMKVSFFSVSAKWNGFLVTASSHSSSFMSSHPVVLYTTEKKRYTSWIVYFSFLKPPSCSVTRLESPWFYLRNIASVSTSSFSTPHLEWQGDYQLWQLPPDNLCCTL